jgi:hypothetical protein
MNDPGNVMAPAPDEELWTAADVARFLKLSRRWVYTKTGEGRIPTVDLFGVIRYDPADIRALKEKLKRKPARVLFPVKP